MKISICHYSFNRTFAARSWTLVDLVGAVGRCEVDGIDFHQRLVGDPKTAAERIGEAMAGSTLELSGLSLSTNFNTVGHEYTQQIDAAIKWIEIAGAVAAPVSRVFGGHLAPDDRNDAAKKRDGMRRIVKALSELVHAASENRVVLALENHGGLPCLAEEQIEAIGTIGSPFLKATVDVGNYMQGGQSGLDGTRIAAPHAAYVHIKDFRRKADGSLEATVVGEGEVDHAGCLMLLKAAGYDGYVALEYEAAEDETSGIEKSLRHVRKVLANA